MAVRNQFGTLNEFNSSAESITAYLERVDLYFTANSVTEDKKVATFLSVVGATIYSTLRDLFAPDSPKDKTLPQIFARLKLHYEPKRTIIVERYHFHKRDQAAGETIADYEAAIRNLAKYCEFQDYLEQALRDRLVCGIREEAIRRRLLSEKDLTLAKAIELALSMEAAQKDARFVNSNDPSIKKLHFQQKRKSSQQSPCSRCGKVNHSASTCKFKDATCHACGKKGHIAPACRSKPVKKPTKSQASGSNRPATIQPQGTLNTVQTEETIGSDLETEEFYTFTLKASATAPIKVSIDVDGKMLTMEVDTGAAVTIISETTRKSIFPKLKLNRSSIALKTYTDEPIKILGEANVDVAYNKQMATLPLIVVAGNGPNLLGRNWFRSLKLGGQYVATIKDSTTDLKTILNRHNTLFKDELGTIQPQKATLRVQGDAAPKFFKPRPMPFALKDVVGQELDRLEKQGVIKKVESSDWAAPIVTVPKPEGKIRLCGDYKVTINQALTVDQYPLPKPEDLFATLANGHKFTKLDLRQAYLQLQLDESSQPYVTINTHQGLYQYTRLPFGIASAPAIFQRLMDTVLQGLPSVVCYIDDILVTGKNEEDHLNNLNEVLSRLEKHGFRLKRDKCTFLVDSVDYLGHRIDRDGIRALPKKVDAIANAPEPRNVQELRSFLGLVNYYGKFIRNLASILHPLNQLLQANKEWEWTRKCTEAFQAAKDQLLSADVLTHYNPKLPLRLAADASAYGIGAVISHVLPDGSERPISFASRTLTASEKNYSQLDKEALSLTYGVKKFHQYLYGRKFTLITDHKPLTAIFGAKKGIPTLAAARLQRWALLLSAYQYEIQYKPTDSHSNADGLSRLPLPIVDSDVGGEGVTMFNISQIQSLPVTFKRVQQATKTDPVLNRVLRYTREGWPKEVPDELKPYYSRREEISIETDCLLWGIRVIIPSTLQKKVLETLHEGHPGIQRMKVMARSYLWWNGMDGDIEIQAKSCKPCQEHKPNPPVAPLHLWQWPTSPLKRVHIDFAGPFQGKMFLIIVDAHSKWPEVLVMSSTTSTKTIEALSSFFARYGLPEQLVSDNGPQFTSQEFENFTEQHGIKHIKSAPYHPSTNGLAERFVQTFKNAMKASEHDGHSLITRLNVFLGKYRTTPHATTKTSPSELFLGRKVRTKLDLLKPDLAGVVQESQLRQKKHHDKHAKLRAYTTGQLVTVRDYLSSKKWMSGKISSVLGPTMYKVILANGSTVIRHIDQIRDRKFADPPEDDPFKFFAGGSETADTIPEQPSAPPQHNSPPPRKSYPRRDRQPVERLMTCRT